MEEQPVTQANAGFSPTGPQRRAIGTLDRDLVVTAGAGSGKTSVLVRHFIAALRREQCDVTAVVAITFTRKAALEMVERLRAEFRRLAAANSAPGTLYWQRQLQLLPQAQVSTFHSFCSSLLRRFPLLADIDPLFTLLDAEEASQLHQNQLTALLRGRAAKDEAVQDLINRYGMSRLRDLLDASWLAAAQSGQPLAGLLDVTSEELAKAQAELTHCAGDLSRLLERLAGEVEAASSLTAGTRKRTAQALALALRLEDWRQQLGGESPALNSSGAWKIIQGLGQATRYVWSKPLEELRQELRSLLEQLEEGLASQVYAADFPTIAGLLLAYDQRLAAAKRTRGSLEYIDLELAACRLLANQPQAREKLVAGYHHLLVDEFQDTSPLQWRLVQLLTREQGLRLFVAGDPKQSIYRFRGADVSIFGAVQEQVERGGGEILDLDTNFRSHQGLVDHFNHAFGQLMSSDAADGKTAATTSSVYRTPYTDARANRQSPAEHCLELLLCDEQAAAAASISGALFEARYLAHHLQQVVDGEELQVTTATGTRPLEYGDVTILLRQMTHVRAYEQALSERGIAYQTVGSGGLLEQQDIQDLLSAMRIAVNPADNYSLVAWLRSPLVGLDDELLIQLAEYRRQHCAGAAYAELLTGSHLARLSRQFKSGRDPLAAALLTDAAGQLQKLLELAVQPPLELLDFILEETQLQPLLSVLPSGSQRLLNLQRFRSQVAHYQQAGYQLPAVLERLDWLLQQGSDQAVAQLEQDSGSVQLMTIHQAKGLEFPVVLLAGCSHDLYRGSSQPFVDRELGLHWPVVDERGEKLEPAHFRQLKERHRQAELEEAKRLLYVAMTRAREHLLLSINPGRTPQPGRGFNQAKRLSTWLFKMLGLEDWEDVLDKATSQGGRYQLSGSPGPVRITLEPAFSGQLDLSLPAGPYQELAQRAKLLMDQPPAAPAAPASSRRLPVLPAATSLAESMTVTQLNQYYQCPRCFLQEQVLGLPPAPVVDRSPSGSTSRIDPLRRGSILHRVCELMGHQCGASAAVDKVLEENVLSAEEQAEMEPELLDVAQRYQVSPLYQSVLALDPEQVYSEVPFTLHLGDGWQLQGQVDKILVGEQGLTVVDFKSGYRSYTGDRIDQAASIYQAQMAVYAQAAEALFGRPVERCSLLFLEAAGGTTVDLNLNFDRFQNPDLLALQQKLAHNLTWNAFPPAPSCERQHLPASE